MKSAAGLRMLQVSAIVRRMVSQRVSMAVTRD